MIELNEQQIYAVNYPGNVLVTACPGSGKTRVLTSRVIKGMGELSSSKQRVVALTFTNRAADEIESRLDELAINKNSFWAGTFHSFALEWVLRPYAPYVPRLKTGFAVADEFYSQRILNELKSQFNVSPYFSVNTKRRRDGKVWNVNQTASLICRKYHERLRDSRLIDYDDVLFYAFTILNIIHEIPQTLADIVRLICVDEIQDTQDLQYGILSSIVKASSDTPILFLVGDADQCIYESLGAVSKTREEIAGEFGLESLEELHLTGNYRSSQRIIDYYRTFRIQSPKIQSLARHSAQPGVITFHNQTVTKQDLPELISQLILSSVHAGIAPSQICVLAPHWWHIQSLGRSLVQLLPAIDFDAPGLSPFHSQRDNFWFKLARLALTAPTPSLFATRLRWTKDIIRDLGDVYGVSIPKLYQNPRAFLRFINSIQPPVEEGLDYIKELFEAVVTELGFNLTTVDHLFDAHTLFFDKARERLNQNEWSKDVQSLKKFFKHPSGVVISTCHAIKGEEYETVIAFGLLRGYVPNWQVIKDGDQMEVREQESKLLYVICSRAKQRLHLIAESGRFTNNNKPYQTASLLNFNFNYDVQEDILLETATR